MRERSTIEKLLENTLALTCAAKATVRYTSERHIATRFGENAITQNLSGEEEELTLSVAFGARHGSASTTDLSKNSLSRLVERAESNAKLSPEDPEYVQPAPVQTHPKVAQRYFKEVAELTPEDIGLDVARVVHLAQSDNLVAGGLFKVSISVEALANSRNLSAYDQRSNIGYSLTMSGPSGTGEASGFSESIALLDVNSIAQRAIQTALVAQEPVDIEPGEYRVILEPQAMADLLDFYVWSMDARKAHEGSSAFTGRVGKPIASPLISLRTLTDSPLLPSKPFGDSGLSAKAQTWIQDGTLNRLRHDRFWAKQQNQEPDPALYPLFMGAGEQSIDELIQSCPEGLLVKRLWYIRFVDQRELLLTGMTREWSFSYQRWKNTRPVKNMRFNESPLNVLTNAEALSKAQRIGNRYVLPAVMSRRFRFCSKTDSI